jgi:hypothetical protein
VLASATWAHVLLGEIAVDELETLAQEGEKVGDWRLWAHAQGYLAKWELLTGRAEAAVQRLARVVACQDLE